MPGEQVAGWLWNHINNTWEKAPAVVTYDRRVGTGLIVGGEHKLYWVACNPAAGNSVWELTDAVAALGPVALDHFHTGREGHILLINPPMNFTVGIYLETFTNMTSVVVGYV